MLKIYLQIFGTIALCVILWFNYSVFLQKPMKAKIATTQAEVKKLQAQNDVLGQILDFKPYFAKLEQLHADDYVDVKGFFARTFNEPRFMHRIQKMVDLAGCETDGIRVGKVTPGKKISDFGKNFKPEPKDQKGLEGSVQAFIKTMGTYTKDSKKWQGIAGPEADYANRLLFYHEIGAGKKYPGAMTGGFDIHRFQLTVKGPYNNCKKFLWLVGQNRPYTQVLVHSFVPITKGMGIEKIFACRVTVYTYVDRNGEMPVKAATQPAETPPDVGATETKETTEKPAETPAATETKTEEKAEQKVNPQAPVAQEKK